MGFKEFGPFEIPDGECLTCGCCKGEAPLNFDWVKSDDGYETMQVVRQLCSEEELNNMLRAASVCMVSCIYYCGDDPEIAARMELALEGDVSHCGCGGPEYH